MMRKTSFLRNDQLDRFGRYFMIIISRRYSQPD
jgi:hypothetical protein